MSHDDHEHEEHEEHEHSGHDHVHDHDGHRHDHSDHDHEHTELANGEVEVNLHEEGAIIASGSLSLSGVDSEDMTNRLAAALQQVAQNIDNAGGMIGHLKATISRTDVRMLSTTAAETEVSIKLSPSSEVVANVVLIAFMVEPDELLKWGQELMASLQQA